MVTVEPLKVIPNGLIQIELATRRLLDQCREQFYLAIDTQKRLVLHRRLYRQLLPLLFQARALKIQHDAPSLRICQSFSKRHAAPRWRSDTMIEPPPVIAELIRTRTQP